MMVTMSMVMMMVTTMMMRVWRVQGGAADDDAFDVLVDFIEFVVLHEQTEEHARDSDADGDDENLGHGFLVSAVDGFTRGVAHRPSVRRETNVTVDVICAVLGFFREVLVEFVEDVAAPDRAGNG